MAFGPVLLFMAALPGLAAPPALSHPAWTGSQFQFVVTGASNSSYIIEHSADLLTWTPALTNSDALTMRLISVPAPGTCGFWRVVRVPEPLFVNAIAAQGTVILGGSGRIDSFNSALPGIESDVNGQYDPALVTDRAKIATMSRDLGAIYVGNMDVYGAVATGPGGTATLGPNGNVGSSAWNDNPASAGMIEPGHFTDDADVLVPNATLPSGFGSPLQVPGPGVVESNAYAYVLGHGDYRIGNFSLGLGASMIVTGRARIHITGATTVSVTGSIIITTNGSLEWYAGGPVNIGGSGVVNRAGYPTNFALIGLRTCPSISYSGSSQFNGTIYAPHSTVGISGTADAIGAVVARSFTLSGSMGLHFDENLQRVGPFF